MTRREIITGILIILALIVFIKKDFFFTELPNKIFNSHRYKSDSLRIVMNTPVTDLSPYSLNLNNLIRTANIYEGLVAFDKNLKIIPALAVSWGNINPVTWEFKLRKEVLFHDSTKFTTQDVIRNFKEAKASENSQVFGQISSIKEIKAINADTIRIITLKPDPLILSKLTKFHISKPGNIGTGPFVIKEHSPGNSLILTAFEDYWGRKSAYREAEYLVVKSKTQRKRDFEEGITDILVAVPKDQALELPKDQVKTSYSLEVNFLMFKLDDPLLNDKKIREAIRTIINPEKIREIGNEFVRSVSQFIAPGVFGYNPDIMPYEYDEEKRAKDIFGEQRKKISLDYLSTYKTLSDYISNQLRDAGFLVSANAVDPAELLDRIKNNISQMFIIGWQFENGDAGPFLEAFIHSKGEFNNGRYKNEKVDKLIDQSKQELNPEIRLGFLRDAVQISYDDLIGIPLFESSRLYAVRRGVRWEPRLDGLVLAKEVR